MERNTVYTRWNVGLTGRVIDTVLQIRYDTINWSLCDKKFTTFRFRCSCHAFRDVSARTVPDNRGKTAARCSSGLGFLYVVKAQERP
jgi:predicted SprT family Zn-dependent metalloprotease